LPPSDSVTAEPIQSLSAATSEVNAQAHLFQSLASRMATATVGLVKAVTPGGTGGASFVDIQPMVSQVDGAGNAVPHGTIHNVPVFRLQSGGNAVILDPAVGDIGIVVFAMRDISVVKTSRAPSQPGSARRYDMADALYIGGVLNGGATQFVQFVSGGGINITATGPVNITTSGAVAITSSALTHNGKNVGDTHVHSGVTIGGANTQAPV